MAVNKYLPTPDNGFSDAGSYVGTSSADYNGPGFASLKITSKQPVMNNRTNGGLLVRRVKAYQKWELGIQYNSLSKEEFLAVHSFVLERQQTLEPFFVELPQFSGNSKDIQEDASAGERQLLINNDDGIKVGDMFTVNDPSKITHKKAYQVVRVERNGATGDYTNNTATSPAAGKCRLTFSPALQKDVESTNSSVNFNVKIQAIPSADTIQYTLDKNGLYKFSLKLEEACY
jgi:hypothetical protein